MKTHISHRQIDKLTRKLNHLRFGLGVQVDQINIKTSVPSIRAILGNHDETGRLAAQVRQALLQGAI